MQQNMKNTVVPSRIQDKAEISLCSVFKASVKN